jgi:hypothetical protein
MNNLMRSYAVRMNTSVGISTSVSTSASTTYSSVRMYAGRNECSSTDSTRLDIEEGLEKGGAD